MRITSAVFSGRFNFFITTSPKYHVYLGKHCIQFINKLNTNAPYLWQGTFHLLLQYNMIVDNGV